MAGLILIFLIIAWPVVSVLIAHSIFKNTQHNRRAKIFSASMILMVLPVAEEAVVVLSFKADCATSAGIVKLEPVRVKSVEISAKAHWNALRLLQHPGIDAVKVVGNTNTRFMPETYWLSLDQGTECLDPVHSQLVNHQVAYARILPRKLEANGFCISSKAFSEDPVFELRISEEAWGGKEEKSFSVVDKRTDKIVSKFVLMARPPGLIRQAIWPYYSSYHCPTGRLEGSEFEYPFKGAENDFLLKAIVSD